MAEAVLQVVLQNLNSLAQKKLASLWGIDREVEKLSSTLTAIQAVLEDAEEKQTTNNAIKVWLGKLIDAAHSLDDILDECSIKGEKYGSSNKVHKFINSSNPKNISFRCKISKRIRDIKERLDEIALERQRYDLREGIIDRRLEDDEWRQTTSVITQTHIYGRDEDKEKIVKFLLGHASNCEDLSIYPIVGTGGVGKTTIAQWVFSDERVKEHFDLKFWVYVSENFGLSSILESIIESALRQFNENPYSEASKKQFSSRKSFRVGHIDTTQMQNYKTLESMQNVVQTLLQNKRYLLVLDDVWTENQELWERLKCVLRCGLKGSSILLTTRLANTACIMGTVQAHHLSVLSEDHCWSLFRQYAFGPDREEKAELVAIGKDIVKKCGHLPLEAKVLGSLVRSKDDKNAWNNVNSKLWDLRDTESSILPALRLSYFNLKSQLKRCFAFCAIFPRKEEIVKEQLIRLWMANGFISSSRNLEVEDVGEEVWKELHERSFFQDVKVDEFGNITSFKMHDLFHDLARHVMGKECVVAEAESSTNNSSRSIHHIGCSGSSHPFNKGKLNEIESLRTFFEFHPSFENFCELPTSGSLRVLRTSSSDLSSLKNLLHLRYLDLYRSKILALPETICSLQKLQTLKLESCHFLFSLPKHLTRLQDLRHIVIRDCKNLIHFPPSIGKLRSLKTLSIFIVGSQRGYRLGELHELQLGGKLHIKGLNDVPSRLDAEQANLIGKKDLNHLYLSWGKKGEQQTTNAQEQVLEALEPHCNLKSFGIQGYKGLHLPNWMISTSVLRNVVAVTLYNCENCQKLPPLGKLSFLRSLYISRMKDVQHIDDDLYDGVVEKAFTSLKTLTLSELPNLERMLKDEGGVEILPQLSKLRVSNVPKILLPCLPSAEHLEVKGCNQPFLEGMLGNSRHLKTLEISGFNLEVLTTDLSGLNELEELTISFCDELESLPKQVLQGLSSLRSLSISYCKKLISLSEAFVHLTSLEELRIICCPELVAFPNDMNQLTSLHMVILTESKLLDGLERIPNLQYLGLYRFPNLKSLPECLGDLTSLQQLLIDDCPELSSLPSSFLSLRNLSIDICESPKLKKLCKKPNWQKIAHYQELLSVYDKFKTYWKVTRTCKRMFPNVVENYDLDFDEMADVEL